MKKITLTPEQEKEICNIYTSTNYGVNYIAGKFHIGKVKVKNILLNNSIPMKKIGKQGDKEQVRNTSTVSNHTGGRKKKQQKNLFLKQFLFMEISMIIQKHVIRMLRQKLK